MSDRPLVAFLDSDFFVYRIGFSAKEDTEQIAKNRLTEWLTDIVYIKLKCEDYKAFLTGKTNFRFGVAKTVPYKGNRKDMEKPPHYDALRNHLIKLGASMSENQEADDDVAIESTRYVGWIVHVDKDLDQLPGWHYNPVKDVEYFVTEEQAHRAFYTQLLTGDRIDNIIGLRGIGPKKAEKLLKGATTEQEMYRIAVKAYEDNEEEYDRLVENAQLLWLRRVPEQMWEAPE